MKRQLQYQRTMKSIYWFVITCLILWGLDLQLPNVSAYQGTTSTPLSTLEYATTELPEVSQSISALSGKYISNEVLIRFKNTATDENILHCLSIVSATVLSSIEEIKVLVVQIPFGTVTESIAIISACPDVRYAEPNYAAFIADTIPSDANWNLQYGLTNIHAPQGWDYSTGSTAVTIAIVDSGVDLSHADLSGKIVPGYDFVNGDSIPQDDYGHGTHVAGIAAAIGNNGLGVAGVSWGARIMPIKVLNASGNGSFADVAAGIIWAADHGAQVINLSVGGSSSSAVLLDAVNYAYGKGVVLIAAAGNTGSNAILYPARYPNVIAVGAVDNTNNHAGFSNYGPELDLVAPGASIYSTVIGGYGYKSGTSMAAPYVSGLAAILRGYPSGYSPDAIALVMQSTSLDLGTPGVDNLYGYGLIQMDRAIQSVIIPPTYTPTSTATSTLTYIPTATVTITPTLTPISTPIFSDVPINYWAWSWIERLYHSGFTGGCSATQLNYCPENAVTRAQMAIFLLKGMHGSGYIPPAVGVSTSFGDVTTNYWAAAWVKQLAAEGITGGCGNGNYCPDAMVTRAQIAIFFLKAKYGESYLPPAASGAFTDVPIGHWADKWIEQLIVEGITSGCSIDLYCPDNAVTRAQMAVFLVKVFNLP